MIKACFCSISPNCLASFADSSVRWVTSTPASAIDSASLSILSVPSTPALIRNDALKFGEFEIKNGICDK